MKVLEEDGDEGWGAEEAGEVVVTEDGEVLASMCRQLAREQIRSYLDGMEQLGFTRQQAIDLVQTWKEEER